MTLWILEDLREKKRYSDYGATIPRGYVPLESDSCSGRHRSPFPFLFPTVLASPTAAALCLLARGKKERREKGSKRRPRACAAVDVPFFSGIQPRSYRSDEDDREAKKKGVNRLGFVGVLATVSLGKTSNLYPLVWTKFHGSNHLF